jgi:two-component system, sporulation sensor kinase E
VSNEEVMVLSILNHEYLVRLSDIDKFSDQFTLHSMVIIDEQERIVHCNRNFEQFCGYTLLQLSAMSISDLVHFDSDVHTLYDQIFKEQPEDLWLQPYEVTVVTSSGEEILQRYSIHKIDQDKLYFILYFRDTNESALNLFQRFSAAFLQDVNLGVMLISTNFTLVDISDMACRILGFDKLAILNKPMEVVFASVPIEHRLVQRTILDGMIVRNHAISWTNNQKRYELLLDSNVLRDRHGRVVGAYILFKDVTNLRSLEEQVQRSDRLKMIGQIAAGTAHEIRNPLTSIKGFLQVFRKTFMVNGMSKEQSYTEVMLAEIDRVNELVNEFLLLSKPKNVTLQATDISNVLRGILPIINNEAILHKVQLQYEASYYLPTVIADQELLKQVFLNICKNGIEAMANEGGVMTITEKADPEERNVCIEISDTGPGIPMFVIDKIFDPFFTTKESGTGLGLSVCQRIIHDMGGNIRVESRGVGSKFTVCIPYP